VTKDEDYRLPKQYNITLWDYSGYTGISIKNEKSIKDQPALIKISLQYPDKLTITIGSDRHRLEDDDEDASIANKIAEYIEEIK